MKQTPIPPYKFLAVFVAAGLMTGAVSYYQAELGAIQAPPPSNDSGQVQSDIRGAIELAKSAKNQLEYATSGRSAEDVFSNLAALHNPKKWYIACQTLESLSGEELAFYDQPLHAAKYEAIVPCITELRRKLREYWLESRDALDAHAQLTGPEIKTPVTTEERSLKTASPLLNEGEVALVFEGGPFVSRTERILDILKAMGIRADFFLNGKACRAHPEIVQKLARENQALGTSGMNNHPLDVQPLKDSEQSILDGRDSLHAASGVNSPLFAFPQQASSRPLLEFLEQQKMTPLIMPSVSPPGHPWTTIDSRDWQLVSPTQLYDHVLDSAAQAEKAKQGILIRFHDRFDSTVIALPFILRKLLSQGFKPVVAVP